MSNPIDTNSALAFLLASYTRSAPEDMGVSAPKVVAPMTRSVKTHVVNDGAQAAPRDSIKPIPKIGDIFIPGTLNAKGFLVASRRADTLEKRQAAIGAYIGYNHALPFGEQDSAARQQAQRELAPVAAGSVPFTRGTMATVNGYVKGAADHAAKRLANLKARELLAVETMLLHAENSRSAKSEAGKTLYAGLALAEQERLAEIRRDIASQ
jgi:hypothetical protein